MTDKQADRVMADKEADGNTTSRHRGKVILTE